MPIRIGDAATAWPHRTVELALTITLKGDKLTLTGETGLDLLDYEGMLRRTSPPAPLRKQRGEQSASVSPSGFPSPNSERGAGGEVNVPVAVMNSKFTFKVNIVALDSSSATAAAP